MDLCAFSVLHKATKDLPCLYFFHLSTGKSLKLAYPLSLKFKCAS